MRKPKVQEKFTFKRKQKAKLPYFIERSLQFVGIPQ